MNICIAGWYFREDLLRRLRGWNGMDTSCRPDKLHDVRIVAHREGNPMGLPMDLEPNRGLEFGCYASYLEKRWDGVSDVLFMHDDAEIDDISVLAQIAAMAEQPMDQIFLFNNEYEEFVNGGHHGRAFWCRGSWLKEFRECDGFRVDWENRGDTESPALNNGIRAFSSKMKQYWPERTGFAAIVPGLHLGRRGWMSDRPYIYKRTTPGLMTPQEVSA